MCCPRHTTAEYRRRAARPRGPRGEPGRIGGTKIRRAGPAGWRGGIAHGAGEIRGYGEADGRALAGPAPEASPGKAAVRPNQVVARNAQARA